MPELTVPPPAGAATGEEGTEIELEGLTSVERDVALFELLLRMLAEAVLATAVVLLLCAVALGTVIVADGRAALTAELGTTAVATMPEAALGALAEGDGLPVPGAEGGTVVAVPGDQNAGVGGLERRLLAPIDCPELVRCDVVEAGDTPSLGCGLLVFGRLAEYEPLPEFKVGVSLVA